MGHWECIRYLYLVFASGLGSGFGKYIGRSKKIQRLRSRYVLYVRADRRHSLQVLMFDPYSAKRKFKVGNFWLFSQTVISAFEPKAQIFCILTGSVACAPNVSV